MIETTIVGNVGSSRFATAGQTPVLNVSIATSRKLGEREFTDWVSAKIWGERAVKLQPFVLKGAKLLLRGRPEARAYKRQDGTPVGELVLHVSVLEFLSPKSSQPENESALLPLDGNGGRKRKRKSAEP